MATSTVRRILMPRQWQHQQSEEFWCLGNVNINSQNNTDASAMSTSTVRIILMPQQWQHHQSEEFWCLGNGNNNSQKSITFKTSNGIWPWQIENVST
jgi:2-polyprenyl-6-methoxyphenol hydroxylase-like FAD-dependent oxidoreductase